ncbi:hypothetical protein [Brevundimonas sp. FT23042]|uniref:hypothetical protein n=1 Tax=Brevundimonas sp. FT23042 TaxID=3393749 RepID=UPI003B588CB1
MNDADRIEALLDIVDPERIADAARSDQLVVLGLAEKHGRTVRPTAAGWNLMSDAGRTFDPQR